MISKIKVKELRNNNSLIFFRIKFFEVELLKLLSNQINLPISECVDDWIYKTIYISDPSDYSLNNVRGSIVWIIQKYYRL